MQQQHHSRRRFTCPPSGQLAVLALTVLALTVLALAGCTRGSTSSYAPIHPNPNMDRQPKYRAQAESAFFYDGATMRVPIAGTVARGELERYLNRPLWEGRDDAGELVAASPLTVDAALLERGRQRYEIYCTPCHASSGNGRGALYDRSQIEAGDLRQERLLEAPDGHFFDVVTNGLGLMRGYKYPIPVEDRWAIVAHVRQLQGDSR